MYLLLAYHPGERKELLPEGFDGSFYPPIENVPKPYRIIRANQYMVDTVDAVICYVNHIGNTRELLNHIYRRKKMAGELIDNIALP